MYSITQPSSLGKEWVQDFLPLLEAPAAGAVEHDVVDSRGGRDVDAHRAPVPHLPLQLLHAQQPGSTSFRKLEEGRER